MKILCRLQQTHNIKGTSFNPALMKIFYQMIYSENLFSSTPVWFEPNDNPVMERMNKLELLIQPGTDKADSLPK